MQIDFKKLIKKYETNLVDKLRGFGEEEFLNFWVPASDDLNSIINLIVYVNRYSLIIFVCYKFSY